MEKYTMFMDWKNQYSENEYKICLENNSHQHPAIDSSKIYVRTMDKELGFSRDP